ncbi:guanine nucleotide exchange factor, partial [Tremellales sp. Uapishka_1]
MSEPSQSDIFAALAAQTSGTFRRPAPPTHSFASLAQHITSAPKNTMKLYCFRPQCSSVILQPVAGEFIQAEDPVLPHDPTSPFPPTEQKGYFYVPTHFTFDNIGFSRPDLAVTLPPSTPGLEGEEKKVKWLICAECDMGPLGWNFEGEQGCWIDCERVRYGEK